MKDASGLGRALVLGATAAGAVSGCMLPAMKTPASTDFTYTHTPAETPGPALSTASGTAPMSAKERIEAWSSELNPSFRSEVKTTEVGPFVVAWASGPVGAVATDQGLIGSAALEPVETCQDIDGDGRPDLLGMRDNPDETRGVVVVLDKPEGPQEVEVDTRLSPFQTLYGADWADHDGKKAIQVTFSAYSDQPGGTVLLTWDGEKVAAPEPPLRPGPGEVVVCSTGVGEAGDSGLFPTACVDLNVKNGRIASVEMSYPTDAGFRVGKLQRNGQRVADGQWLELPMAFSVSTVESDKVREHPDGAGTYRVRIQGPVFELDAGGTAPARGTCAVKKEERTTR